MLEKFGGKSLILVDIELAGQYRFLFLKLNKKRNKNDLKSSERDHKKSYLSVFKGKEKEKEKIR